MADCVYRQWILKVFLGPFSNVNDRIMPMRPRTSKKRLRSCPLRTEISPVSLNLLMMLCTVDDEICKAFAIFTLRNIVFKIFHNILWNNRTLRSPVVLHCPAEIHKALPEIDVIWRGAYVAQKPLYTFQHS